MEKAPITKLKLYSKNPRQISDDQFQALCDGLIEHGFVSPLIVNQDNIVLGGNQRLKAARKLVKDGHAEFKSVPIHRYETIDDAHLARAAMIDNNEFGEYDFQKLSNQLTELSIKIEELPSLGFTELEVGELTELSGPGDPDPSRGNADKVPEIDKTPVVKSGELWTLGKHRLLCGDCTDESNVTILMDGKKAILMVTDPPFGVNYDPKWRHGSDNEKIQNDDRVNWSDAWKLSPSDIAYVWNASSLNDIVINSLENNGFERKYLIIWNKDLPLLSRGDYNWKHECCWYAVKKGCKHNWQGDKKQTTVWDIPTIHSFKNGKNKDEWGLLGHPTQKPIECMERPILNNSAKGELVFDPFLGSGTTLIACEKTGRICYGMEIDPWYCTVILQRYLDYSGIMPVREDGKTYKESKTDNS